MLCPSCGRIFPDEQTGTPREHRVERCRELNAAAAEAWPRIRAGLKRHLMVNCELPEAWAEAALGRHGGAR